MSIREKIEWGKDKQAWGYVDLGNGGESEEIAREVLVFMAVCVNKSWKIPLGYFPVRTLNSIQKASLMVHCFRNVIETKSEVIEFVFDGPPINLSAALHLGTNFDNVTAPTTITIEGYDKEIMLSLDVCLNIKNVRNSWES